MQRTSYKMTRVMIQLPFDDRLHDAYIAFVSKATLDETLVASSLEITSYVLW